MWHKRYKKCVVADRRSSSSNAGCISKNWPIISCVCINSVWCMIVARLLNVRLFFISYLFRSPIAHGGATWYTYLCCVVCAAVPIQMPSNLSPVAFCQWPDSRPPNTTPARQPSGELLILRSKFLMNFFRPKSNHLSVFLSRVKAPHAAPNNERLTQVTKSHFAKLLIDSEFLFFFFFSGQLLVSIYLLLLFFFFASR